MERKIILPSLKKLLINSFKDIKIVYSRKINKIKAIGFNDEEKRMLKKIVKSIV